jgi:hypothetical protein
MSSSRHGALSRTSWMCAVWLLCATSRAEERCDFEAKLLLTPAETQVAIATLNATKETAGRVYFFDTSTLDLLSEGVIVRLRQGANNDLTVKLRPPAGKDFKGSCGRQCKCEVDLTGSGAIQSYSIREKYARKRLPRTGGEVLDLLSSAQKKLLEESQVSIDWTGVKRIGEIGFTAWQIRSQPHLNKLALELWEWPTGKVLEVSAKGPAHAGPATHTALQELAKSRRLSLSPLQGPKTAIALKELTDSGEAPR